MEPVSYVKSIPEILDVGVVVVALKKEAAEEVMVGEKMEMETKRRMVAHHVNDRIKMEIVPVHPLPLLQKVKIIKMLAIIKDQILTMQHKQRRVISLELQER